ncbi:MAG: hypothetical protein L0154_30295 [Chloroflexi bacterium]|nr:hypothetical protein [Chloroflexota bacterium]
MSDRELRRRAGRAIFRNAVISPQSLSILVIALMGVLLNISFLGLDPAAWLIFGAIAELLYVGFTFSDPHAASAAVSRMFRREFDPRTVRNQHARQRLEQALEYYNQMSRLAAQTSGARRVQMDATISRVDDWIESIYRIAHRIDNYEENDLINRDRLRVPNDLKVMRQRLSSEPDESIREEIEESIRMKETQWRNLQDLDAYVKRADVQLDATLTALGTIFAQLQLMDSKAIDNSRAARLKEKIDEEVLSLRDTIDTIDDVQAHSLYTLSAYSE